MNRAALEQKVAAKIELKRRRALAFSVYGIYDHKTDESGNVLWVKLIRCWVWDGGKFVPTDAKPTIKVALKLEPALLTPKPIKIIKGGRGSGKSEGASDILAAGVKDHSYKLGCFREFQNSISDSVHAIISRKIVQGGYQGFEVLEAKINHDKGGMVRYRGLARNPEGIKSSDGFNRAWVEEAQTMSAKSLENLEPTFREAGAEIWYTLNPGSSADPISVEHLKPYEKQLTREGLYEDNDILIVEMNWRDNPWFPEILNAKRLKNKQQWSSAKYEHVWEGAFSDEVDGSIIRSEWFDACIDAHKLDRLASAFKPLGAVIAAHDPFDGGGDAGGLAIRHGSIVKAVLSKNSGEIDEVCDWATGLAIQHNVDWFVWDGDGMGTGLKRQVSDAFAGKQVKYHMFRGSLAGTGQDNANKTYMPDDGDKDTKPKTYAETFKNNRSQYYSELARRCHNTYKCVVLGQYIDPDDMISFDSDGIENIANLRSEICRIPDKPNGQGLIQIMSKQDMKSKHGIDSPNEGDSVMMCLFSPVVKPVATKINFSGWN
jgi:phage terminase large subunit